MSNGRHCAFVSIAVAHPLTSFIAREPHVRLGMWPYVRSGDAVDDGASIDRARALDRHRPSRLGKCG